VSPEERKAVTAHLARCKACHAEFVRLRAAVQALPLALEEREPATALRDRVEAAVLDEFTKEGRPAAQERPPAILRPHGARATMPVLSVGSRTGGRSVTAWAAAAALLLAFSLGMLGWNLRLHQALGQQEEEVAIALRPARLAARGVGGRLPYPADREVMVVTVRGLPPLSPGLIYEVWPAHPDAPVPASPAAQGRTDSAVAADPTDHEALASAGEADLVGEPTRWAPRASVPRPSPRRHGLAGGQRASPATRAATPASPAPPAGLPVIRTRCRPRCTRYHRLAAVAVGEDGR